MAKRRPEDDGFIPKLREEAIFYNRFRRCKPAENCIAKYTSEVRTAKCDLRSLNALTDARLLLYRLDSSQNAADEAVECDNQHMASLLRKGYVNFQRGNFEDALVILHRGKRKRIKPPYFIEKIGAISEIMEDCIGSNVGAILIELPKYIEGMEERKRKKMQHLRSRSPPPTVAEVNRTVKRDRYLAGRFLCLLHRDKAFLEEVKRDPDVVSVNKAANEKLKSLLEEAHTDINAVQAALFRRSPIYTDKFKELLFSDKLRRRQMIGIDNIKRDIHSTANQMLDQLREYRAQKNYKKFLYTIERAKTYLDAKPLKYLSKKQLYLETVYNIAALGYLDMRRMDDRITDHDTKLSIAHYLGLSVPGLGTGAAGALDNILKSTTMPFIDYKKNIRKAELRLPAAERPVERCWLYFELAHAHCESGKMDVAKAFAKRCVAEAKPIHNYAWCVNASVVIAKCEFAQRNKFEARIALQEAIEFSHKIKIDGVTRYLQMCTNVVDECDYQDKGVSGIEGREKTIVSLMSDAEIRGEVQMLFQRMGNLPADRRMSLLPGVMPVDKERKKVPKDFTSAVADTSVVRTRTIRFEREDDVPTEASAL